MVRHGDRSRFRGGCASSGAGWLSPVGARGGTAAQMPSAVFGEAFGKVSGLRAACTTGAMVHGGPSLGRHCAALGPRVGREWATTGPRVGQRIPRRPFPFAPRPWNLGA